MADPADAVADFYNQLAGDYHLIFAGWRAAVDRQGEQLDRLIRGRLGARPLAVLDCTCGIGTQAIGLARRGYRVHATDLSPAAADRARREATAFGVAVTWGVADVRQLDRQVVGAFDVVLSCDNSLPHLLTDEDLRLAARAMWSKLRPGGLLLVSIRDYDQLVEERPRATMPSLLDGSGGRRVYFQLWEWSPEGTRYRLHLFILKETAGRWRTTHAATEYRALRRDELSDALRHAGFTDLCWHPPEESGYYQPIVTARRL